MKAAVLHGIHDLRLEDRDAPEPAPGEVIVAAKQTGICGSDVHFYLDGRVGAFVITGPVVPGHETAGEVIAVGPGVTTHAIGDRVAIEPGIPCRACGYCKSGRYNLCPDVQFLSAPPLDGTFCEQVAVPADFAHRLPAGLDFEQGAAVEPLAVGVHAVNRSGMRLGDSVVIFGAGPVGLLLLQVARARGAGRVFVIDPVEPRLALASQLGADETINPAKQDALATVEADLGGEGADVVFEAAGAVAATKATIDFARPGGSIVLIGWPGEREFPFKMEDIIPKEVRLTGVHRYANAYPAAIALLAGGAVDARPIITHHFKFSRVVEAFDFAASRPEDAVKIMVDMAE